MRGHFLWPLTFWEKLPILHALLTATMTNILLVTAVFEYSVLRGQEIYALENVVFYIAVYGPNKPIHTTRNVQTQLKSTVWYPWTLWIVYFYALELLVMLLCMFL